MPVIVFQYEVPKAGYFTWPTTDDRRVPIVELKTRRQIVGLSYTGRKGARGIKKIVVSRRADGSLYVSPDVKVVWEPMTPSLREVADQVAQHAAALPESRRRRFVFALARAALYLSPDEMDAIEPILFRSLGRRMIEEASKPEGK